MTDLLTRAELVKLSRVLGTNEAALGFLAQREHLELRQLADRVSAALFDEHRRALQRLADASRLLPASLVAKMSELVFGPVLSARVAGLMPPERAVEVAGKLRTRFLADVTIQLDPRSASEVLARIPAKTIVEVAQLLLQRGEYVTMGRFVDGLPDAAIRAVVENVRDDAALVRIASYVERRERLIELIEMIPPDRLQRSIATVADGPEDLQVSGLVMMSRLSDRQQGRVGDIAIALGPEAVRKLVAAAGRLGASDVLRNVLRHLSAEGKRGLVKIVPGFL
jgi:hypothetical protein